MSSSSQPTVKQFTPPSKLKSLAILFTIIGVLGFAIGIIRQPQGMWPAYLTAFFFVSTLGLGGFFWVAINNLAKAGWSVSIRRLAEGMTSFIPVMVVGSFILLLGVKVLYPWADHDVVASQPMIHAKSGYLNVGFLLVRLAVFGFGMWFFAKKIVGNSIQQDQSGDESYTHKNVGLSIGWVLFFAITFSLFSVDLLMSLLPTWYSTIFGIYCFAGMFQASLAFLILLMIFMKRHGFISGYLTIEHIHDVAKYLKGFTVFWAYIAFSQFMLIWYANIPEETEYFLMRIHGGWTLISLALLILRFIVPFLVLLPRGVKRNEGHLIWVSALVLVMHYLDIYWMVYPNFHHDGPVFGWNEISLLLGFVGIFFIVLMRFFGKHSLVATRDPRMHEALRHHVTY